MHERAFADSLLPSSPLSHRPSTDHGSVHGVADFGARNNVSPPGHDPTTKAVAECKHSAAPDLDRPVERARAAVATEAAAQRLAVSRGFFAC